LRAEVQKLLAGDEGVSGSLEAAPFNVKAQLVGEADQVGKLSGGEGADSAGQVYGADDLTDSAASGTQDLHFDTAPPDSFPGYQIVREIHRGGQGVVYQAVQKHTHRKVAIKVMKEGPFASKRDKARFEREVEVLGQLNHPNIVGVHGSGMAAGSFYFVMDYISGQPLDVWMAAKEHEIAASLQLFAKICEAVNAAHLRGVIHRDLKPGNIRIDAEGAPHILDFGLAKVATAMDASLMTVTGQFMGSLPWASPEQAEAIPEKIDLRTDVYSLGVILYQMLTGEFPYDVVGNMRDVLDRIINAEPTRPSTVRRQINDEVETIVLKCLSKERERRYQTAGEVARDIGHYLNGEPIEAKRDSAMYALRKQLRHYKAPIALAMSFVLLLITFGILMSIEAGKNRRLAQSESRAKEQAVGAKNEADRAREIAEAASREATLERDRAERESYFALIGLANADLANAKFDTALTSLTSCPPQCANWEWGWLVRKCNPDTFTLRGHADGVRGVAFSPDGHYLATVSADARAKLWDVASTKLVRTFEGHAKGLRCLAFSPDGERLATGSGDRSVRIWDVRTGGLLLTIQDEPEGINCVAYSPDGKYIATGSGEYFNSVHHSARIRDARSGKTIRSFVGYNVQVTCLCFSPKTGQFLATGSDDGIARIWDVLSGEERAQFVAAPYGLHAIAFSPDGQVIATGLPSGMVRRWDLRRNTELRQLKAWGDIGALAFSPDGRQLVAGSGSHEVFLWDIESGVRFLFLRHSGPVCGIAYSPDGRFIATASEDRTVKLRSTRSISRACVHLEDSVGNVSAFEFCPGSPKVAVLASDGQVRLWDQGNRDWSPAVDSEPAFEMALSSDGHRLATVRDGDRAVKMWESVSDSWHYVRTLPGRAGRAPPIFSPDSRCLAVGLSDGSVIIYDAGTGKPARPTIPAEQQRTEATSLAYSPNGTYLAVGFCEMAGLWDIRTGRLLHTFGGLTHQGAAVAFSPDGKFLAMTAGSGCQVWDIQSEQKSGDLAGHANAPTSVAFSPDGTRLATASLDSTVRLYDVATWRYLITLTRESSTAISRVRFSPDGATIAAVEVGGTGLMLWRGLGSDAKNRIGNSTAALASQIKSWNEEEWDRMFHVTEWKHTPIIEQAPRLPSLSETEREAVNELNSAAWRVVQSPAAAMETRGVALRLAEKCVGLYPDGNNLNTLGVAQYRVGAYGKALEILERADKLNKGIPADVAFIVMAHQQLGQHTQAIAAYARLQEIMRQPKWAPDAESCQFLAEVDALLGKTRTLPQTSRPATSAPRPSRDSGIVSADAGNLLRNASFEDGLAGWTSNPFPLFAIANGYPTPGMAKDGREWAGSSLARGRGVIDAQLCQDVAITAGRKYALSVWVWTDSSPNTCKAYLQWKDGVVSSKGQGMTVASFEENTPKGWQQLKGFVTPTTSTLTFILKLSWDSSRLGGGGNFDLAEVREVDERQGLQTHPAAALQPGR
jgi:eukaryotic-like serine/threonine-protein kinase